MAKPVFKPSATVTAIASGRVRDDSYDDAVKAAYADKGKVFESEFSNAEIDEVRKGLQRSALFLNVRLATDFEQITENEDVPAKVNSKGEETAPATVKYGKTVVRFSAHDKMSRNGSRKPAEGETAETESADA